MSETEGQAPETRPERAPAVSAGVVLSHPIFHGSEEIRELTFRKPRAGDMRGIRITVGEDGVTFDCGAILDLAAKLAAVPPSVMDQLDLEDGAKVAGAVVPLLPASLAKAMG